MKLSPRDRDALDAILAWESVRGKPPTFRALASVLRVSLVRACQIVDRLRVRGALVYGRGILLPWTVRPLPRRRRGTTLRRKKKGYRLVRGFGVT